MEHASDNLIDLHGLFQLVYDKKYAGGSAYVCRGCGAEAHSVEGWFPCQHDFVPQRVWCNECRAKWKLEIMCGSHSDTSS